MTLNTYILWKENKQTHARFPEGDTRPLEKDESLNVSGAGRRAVFMAPSADFIRRSHPKPFGEMAKLYKILPGMLHQSLFKKTKLRSLIVPSALAKGQFSSFSLEEEHLQNFVSEAGSHISPIVHVVPMAMGAVPYASNKTHSIIIAPEGEGVTLSLFTPAKQLIEFRHIAKKAPLPDIKQTLQAWTANLKDIKVVNLTTRKVTAPEGAELETIKFLEQWVDKGASPICGNSVGQDRRFLVKYMPELEAYFHYRTVDVSTIKELARRWKPEVLNGFTKQGTHLALDDIRESISELQYYREHVLKI